MITSLLGFAQFIRSKAVQWAAVIGLALLAFLKVRSEIRTDAQEDVVREMEKRDEVRAQDIRTRVADAARRVHSSELTDDRGFRD